MKVFTYTEARQNLAKLLSLAKEQEVLIRRRDGNTFSLQTKTETGKSPFDVPGIQTSASTRDIIDAVRASRSR